MKYYKLIKDLDFIGVSTTSDMRRFQDRHRLLLSCNESKAQYIENGGKLYHANWMLTVSTDIYKYEVVSVIQIEKEEYDILKDSIESGKDIVVEPDIIPGVKDTVVDQPTEITIEYVRQNKLNEMSATCNTVIENGFDIQLTDGTLAHFSLTTQDQLNLITLSTMIASGETMIPYHADGELCKYYSVTDISMIMNMATNHKTFHVTYHNSLKAYINSLEGIESLSAVQYGMNIPEEYQSDILKGMYKLMMGGSAQ